MEEKVQGKLEKVGGAVLFNKDMRERGQAHELEGSAEIHMAKAEQAAQNGHTSKAVHEQQKANEKLAQIPGAQVSTDPWGTGEHRSTHGAGICAGIACLQPFPSEIPAHISADRPLHSAPAAHVGASPIPG